MTQHARTTELEQFDQGWLDAMEQTPLVRVVAALTKLTRLGAHPASLEVDGSSVHREDDHARSHVLGLQPRQLES